MDKLMVIKDQEIQLITGDIKFESYERFKKEAQEVADYINSVEVNEDTIKESKKLLANVNKGIKQLEDRRIYIKNELLRPYYKFEEQIKEIVGIIKDADASVRDKVRDLEELERLDKKEKLENIWNDRIVMYNFDFVTFDDFIKPYHLNKTTSISNSEKEMIAFLEGIQKDLTAILNLADSESVLIEFMNTLDLGMAITLAEERKRAQTEIKKIYGDNVTGDEYVFKVYSKKDMTMAKMLLEQNNIEYNIL